LHLALSSGEIKLRFLKSDDYSVNFHFFVNCGSPKFVRFFFIFSAVDRFSSRLFDGLRNVRVRFVFVCFALTCVFVLNMRFRMLYSINLQFFRPHISRIVFFSIVNYYS